MEEIVLDHGRVCNPSFTDYVIPTALDMFSSKYRGADTRAGARLALGGQGGEPPAISSVAAVVAAIRDATGLELARVPVRPQDIALAKPIGSPVRQ